MVLLSVVYERVVCLCERVGVECSRLIVVFIFFNPFASHAPTSKMMYIVWFLVFLPIWKGLEGKGKCKRVRIMMQVS